MTVDIPGSSSASTPTAATGQYASTAASVGPASTRSRSLDCACAAWAQCFADSAYQSAIRALRGVMTFGGK